jgi:two-component system, chemotaxis family, sensor kinase CheA
MAESGGSSGWEIERYLQLYLSEAGERLKALASEAVDFEKKQSTESLESMFRHIHSLKGMAASLGFEASATLAHHLEELLSTFRNTAAPLNSATIDTVLQTVDVLSSHISALSTEGVSTVLQPASASLMLRLQVARTPPPPSPQGMQRYGVDIRIAASAQQPHVRGFLVYRRLSAVGTVCSLKPALEELKRGLIPDRRVSLELETNQSLQDIRQVLESVVEVEVERLDLLSGPLEQGVAAIAPVAPGASETSPRSAQPTEQPSTIRIRTDLLDRFLDLAGELTLTAANVKSFANAVGEASKSTFDEATTRLSRLIRSLQDAVMSARMTPLSLVTERLPRVVRDIASRRGREVKLTVSGAEIELDRTIVDALTEPLIHAVRNAVDHGIEPPEERRMRGKDVQGLIHILVARQRDRVRIEISDDGRGIDVERLKVLALEKGLLLPDAVNALSAADALHLVFLPGLSTVPVVNDVSGRGVGMDAVKRSVESFGGSIELRSARSEGTSLVLVLPVSVSMVKLLLVRAGPQRFGIPISRVLGVVDVANETERYSVSKRLLHYGATALPVHALAALLELPQGPAGGSLPYVVVETDTGRLALEVEQLLGQEEVVIKSLARPLDLVPGLSGVAILGDGLPLFVLDVVKLVADA